MEYLIFDVFPYLFQINNSPIESISLVDARKLIEKSKEKIQLIITKKKDDKKKDDGNIFNHTFSLCFFVFLN